MRPVAAFDTKSGIESYVRQKATESGLGEALYETLEHESMGWNNGQSTYPSKTGPNGREDSWGVCQIHLPSSPEVTKEQALDVEFCVAYTIKEFKAGRANRWTSYRLYKAGLI